MKIILISAFILLTEVANAQHLKIDNGVVISSFSNEKELPILDSRIANYFVSVGLDYLERDWFSLSSQVGYLRIGAEQKIINASPEIGEIIEQKKYMHFNTTFRPHLNMYGASFFIGAGPTIDVLVDDRNAENNLFKGYVYNNVRIGGKAEIGIVYDEDKFRFGFVGGYLLDISSTTKSEFLSLYNNTFTIAITVGYSLK